ncbi:GTP-binding protein EngB [Flavobacterium sp. RHBU_3]|uniref:GTP-binding protein EngB n=1 Tax=Flavobacterium sp. RHBU_3 TaxID=3391184 RepID=UPI0039847BE6
MVREEKLNNAIKAVHDLIIKTRALAYENYPALALAKLLDEMEYLPALILEEKDQTEFFESYLEHICKQYNFPEILLRYQS